MSIDKDLKVNSDDIMGAYTRALAGIIPGIGPALSEAINLLLPHQRMERVVKYLLTINDTVEQLGIELKENKEKLNLIELGIQISARATYEQKCVWLGNVVNQGLKNKIEFSIATNAINILDELNYEQIITLYYFVYYKQETFVEQENFRSKFPEILGTATIKKLNIKDREMQHTRWRFNTTKLMNQGLLGRDQKPRSISTLTLGENSGDVGLKRLQQEIEKIRNEFIDTQNSESYIVTTMGKMVIEQMLLSEESLLK